MLVRLLLVTLVGACSASAQRGAVEPGGDDSGYPRYGWATDDACWTVALQYRREVFEHGRAMNTRYGGPDPQIHERKMRGEYDGCMNSREQQQPGACESFQALLAVYMRSRAACRGEAANPQTGLDDVPAPSPATDPDNLASCLDHATGPIQARLATPDCLNQDAAGNPTVDANTCAAEIARQHDEIENMRATCPAALEQFSAARSEDAQLVAKRRDEQRRAQLVASARAAQEQTRLRNEALARAHADPRYAVAVQAKELCSDFSTLADILTAKERMLRVDAASGTVSTNDRRQIAAAELEFRERIANAETLLKKAGGTAPAFEPRTAKANEASQLKKHWCAQPTPTAVEAEFVQGGASQAAHCRANADCTSPQLCWNDQTAPTGGLCVDRDEWREHACVAHGMAAHCRDLGNDEPPPVSPSLNAAGQ